MSEMPWGLWVFLGVSLVLMAVLVTLLVSWAREIHQWGKPCPNPAAGRLIRRLTGEHS